MDLQEIKEHKARLEDALRGLIQEFEAVTTLEIEYAEIRRQHTYVGNIIVAIDIKLKSI